MKKPLRSILVDDEEYCRRDLAELLQKIPTVIVVGEATQAKEAIRLIDDTQPDLVFLDLNLANVDGFKVLAGVEKIPAVIAVTAFPQHALQGFNLNVADYILKPVEENRLKTALQRARDQILLRSLQEPHVVQLEINGRMTPLSITDIHWVKSNENYVEVGTNLGKGLTRSTFTHFRDRLPPNFTIEISRGHVVARHQVQSWKRDPKGHLALALKSGLIVNVAKRLQKEVLQQIELLK